MTTGNRSPASSMESSPCSSRFLAQTGVTGEFVAGLLHPAGGRLRQHRWRGRGELRDAPGSQAARDRGWRFVVFFFVNPNELIIYNNIISYSYYS